MKINKQKLDLAIRHIKLNAEANKRALNSAIDLGYTDNEIGPYVSKNQVYEFVLKELDGIFELWKQ